MESINVNDFDIVGGIVLPMHFYLRDGVKRPSVILSLNNDKIANMIGDTRLPFDVHSSDCNKRAAFSQGLGLFYNDGHANYEKLIKTKAKLLTKTGASEISKNVNILHKLSCYAKFYTKITLIRIPAFVNINKLVEINYKYFASLDDPEFSKTVELLEIDVDDFIRYVEGNDTIKTIHGDTIVMDNSVRMYGKSIINRPEFKTICDNIKYQTVGVFNPNVKPFVPRKSTK